MGILALSLLIAGTVFVVNNEKDIDKAVDVVDTIKTQMSDEFLGGNNEK